MKKFFALFMVMAMIVAMGVSAFADTTLGAAGEQGAFTTPDTPESQSKTLILSKEITAYNADETTINAPTISYTYTIAPATVAANTTITDAASKHTSGEAVTVPVKAGIANPVIANSGVVAWTPADQMTAGTEGVANKKDISIDFSNVVFTGPGVYRYVITEALTAGNAYATSGVTETTDATNGHTRYIDVYVRPATTGYTDGSTAAQWDIYGYTCFYNNTSITEGNKASTPVKTTGFVAGTTDGSTSLLADRYFTFNVLVSKEVVNDGYGASTVAFPFTIIFSNEVATEPVDIIGTIKSGTVTGWTDPSSGSLNTVGANRQGVANIKSGGSIKYIGIPNGTSVEVYETNVATGVTYKVDTALTTSTTATTTDNAVVWGQAPVAAIAQAASKEDFQSTKATFSTTANADDDNAYAVAITNTLLTISPTGVALRVAPYVCMLGLGIFLFILGKRREEDEDAAAA